MQRQLALWLAAALTVVTRVVGARLLDAVLGAFGLCEWITLALSAGFALCDAMPVSVLSYLAEAGGHEVMWACFGADPELTSCFPSALAPADNAMADDTTARSLPL